MIKRLQIKRTRGFTLIEVLVVLAILAVLASLAIPVYTAQTEKSKAQEALLALSATRESLLRYYAQKKTYAGAGLAAGAIPATIDYDPNAVKLGQNPLFTYALAVTGGGSGFSLVATRKGTGQPASGCDPAIPGDTISVNEKGVVTKSAAYQ